MSEQPLGRVTVPDMCALHQSLLVHQVGMGPEDPWRALVVMANIVLFQGATVHPGTYERLQGQIARIEELGCLACYLPHRFGEIVQAAQRNESLKALGEKWIADAA